VSVKTKEHDKLPLHLPQTVAALINVGLDLLFVAVFGWGVAGAAVATVIAQGFRNPNPLTTYCTVSPPTEMITFWIARGVATFKSRRLIAGCL